MTESSRSINHKLNELLSKPTTSKAKLNAPLALSYSSVLKANILSKDKQEKVNSIVVMAKLLDFVSMLRQEAASPAFCEILDETLFNTLFSIVSMKMSTETYKAILKIAVLSIQGGPYPPGFGEHSIDIHLPLLRSLVTYLDVIDVITAKMTVPDNKILLNSIRLVNEIINKSLQHNYDRIITLSGRLKHVKFFSIIETLIDPSDHQIMEATAVLEDAYLRLNNYLSETAFDMSMVSHQVMLTNLFIFLDTSLNEFGTPASTEEYIKAGFTADPKKFVVDHFSILLAMDLKVFLKDPNMTFKKKFHEELIMSDHNRTFPMYIFISECTDIWLQVFKEKDRYPAIGKHILSWEAMIYYSMSNCLALWQDTQSRLECVRDIKGIIQLLKSNVDFLEESLESDAGIEESLEIFAQRTTGDIRLLQFESLKAANAKKWAPRFADFDRNLAKETIDFVCEQRVMQLLKGSWVHTESHAERLFDSKIKKSVISNYYFIMLSPNRNFLHYKEFDEMSMLKPTLEEMEQQSIALKDIASFQSIKIGSLVGEKDKAQIGSLVSVKGTISYEKIILLNKAGQPLLSFYTNSQDKKAVWLDGLKMLKGLVSAEELSSETMKQLNSLQDIRKTTQLLVLEGDAFDALAPGRLVDGEIDNDEFYDLGELEDISQGFYYR